MVLGISGSYSGKQKKMKNRHEDVATTDAGQGKDSMLRSIRMHHRERLKKTRSGYWNGNASETGQPGMVVDTPTPCSCYMCGNPRRHFNEASIQERSSDELAMRLGLEE